MKAPAHVGIGTLTAVLLAKLYAALELGALHYLLVVVGSLAPDIDGGGAITKPGKVLGRFLPFGAARVIDEVFQAISGTLNGTFGHRGALHWPAVGLGIIGDILGLASTDARVHNVELSFGVGIRF